MDVGATVGTLNAFDDNIVVFEAVDISTPTQAATFPKRQIRSGNPLSPKDTNSQSRAKAVLSKSTTPNGDDENAISQPTFTTPNVTQIPEYAVHPRSDQLCKGSTHRYTASPAHEAISTQSCYGSQQQQTPKREENKAPCVKVSQGQFERYRDDWISRFKVAYPTETQGA